MIKTTNCKNCNKEITFDGLWQKEPDFGTCPACTPKELIDFEHKIEDARIDAGREFDAEIEQKKLNYISDKIKPLVDEYIALYNSLKPATYDEIQ